MEYFWIPVVTVVLAAPVVIVVLLIVYISKTQGLSRDTTAIQRDITALRNEMARLNRAYQRLENSIATTTQVVPPVEGRSDLQESARQGMDERPVAPVPRGPLSEADSVAPNVPVPDYIEPREPQVYISPFQVEGEKSLESGGAASRVAAGSATTRRELSGGSRVGEPSMQPAAARSSIEQESGRPSRTRAEWESLIGGRLLNWIGALAIIIGIGFFLGYGYQNDWISPALLVGIGAVTGFALLAGGDLSFRKGYRIFSQGLLGAGISILYLSVYASFNYFHLESQGTAFSMMCTVTVLTFVQAFRFDSLSVSVLGWAGGFLTPVLVSTGQSNEVALFTYIS